jgi:hypothetical protein
MKAAQLVINGPSEANDPKVQPNPFCDHQALRFECVPAP